MNDIIELIDKTISQIRNKEKIQIVYFVTNVVGETSIIDYPQTADSILTEYFTEEEYNQILSAIRMNGLPVKVFFNEDLFISYVLENKQNLNIDECIVFNLARNGKGLCKKSLIPSFCNVHGIPFTGSDAYMTCLGRHKYHYNLILKGLDISVVDSWFYTPQGWLLGQKPLENLKVIAKPTFESASRGVRKDSIFHYSKKNIPFIEALCNEFQQNIIVQKFIQGYEVQVPVVIVKGIPKALMTVGISMDNEHYIDDRIITFSDAWNETYSFYEFQDLPEKQINQIKKCAEDACLCLGISNYGRIDFRIDIGGHFYITDISTHPYLIQHSAFAYAFQKMGYTYSDIFAYIIGNSTM